MSRETDDAARETLASEDRDGDLSKFVEQAVQARIFEITAVEAKRQNARLSAGDVERIVDQALP